MQRGVRSKAGRRDGSLEVLQANGFLFFSEPPAAVQGGGRGATRGRGGGGGNRGGGRGRKSEATQAAQRAEKAAFMLNKYGAEGSRLAAQAAASTVEAVVCEGEKSREERVAELRCEAVPLDDTLRCGLAAGSGAAWAAGEA